MDQMRSVHEYSRVATDNSQQAAVTPPHIHRVTARALMRRRYRASQRSGEGAPKAVAKVT